jgi:flagellar biosynthesis anti-sigma factor FlgM
MRIRERYTTGVAGTAGTPARGRSAGLAAEAQRQSGAADTIRLSDRWLEVQKARGLALSAPDIREPLVNEVSDQIESGRYDVSGEDVAPKMIEEHMADAGR